MGLNGFGARSGHAEGSPPPGVKISPAGTHGGGMIWTGRFLQPSPTPVNRMAVSPRIMGETETPPSLVDDIVYEAFQLHQDSGIDALLHHHKEPGDVQDP